MKQLSLVIGLALLLSSLQSEAISFSPIKNAFRGLAESLSSIRYKLTREKSKKDRLKAIELKTNSPEDIAQDLRNLGMGNIFDTSTGRFSYNCYSTIMQRVPTLGNLRFNLAVFIAHLCDIFEDASRNLNNPILASSVEAIKYDVCKILLKDYPEVYEEVKTCKLLELDNYKKYFKV